MSAFAPSPNRSVLNIGRDSDFSNEPHLELLHCVPARYPSHCNRAGLEGRAMNIDSQLGERRRQQDRKPRGGNGQLPVLRWLQVGAAATGIGLALSATAGIATADDGTSPSRGSSGSSHRTAPAGKAVPATKTGRTSRDTVPAAAAIKHVAAPKATTTPAIKPDIADTRAAAVSTQPAAKPTANASAIGTGKPEIDGTPSVRQSLITTAIHIAEFIDTTGQRLSGGPATPFTEAVTGGLWLFRRALVPVGSDVGLWGKTGCTGSGDCSRQDLKGADLRGQDLAGMNFTQATLRNASLSGADLTGADLSNPRRSQPRRCTSRRLQHDRCGLDGCPGRR